MTQHNRETLLALADRAEEATGPDRGLDAAIAVVLGLPNGPHEIVEYESRSVTYIEQQALPFTASLDAAMSLVPDTEWEWSLEWEQGGGVRDWIARCKMGDPMRFRDVEADTLPLALVAAALRARATLDPTGEKS